MMTLGLLNPGEQCEIIEIRHCGGCSNGCHSGGHHHDHERGNSHIHGPHRKTATRVEELGLRTGKRVEMLSNDGNLLLLLVDEARIAIDQRMAMKIMVRR